MEGNMMDEPKFQPGDRVRCPGGASRPNAREGVVVGPAPMTPEYLVVQWTDGSGIVGLIHFDCLTPLPSPDDEVEVVVRMTRAQRDDVVRVSDGLRVREARRALVAACRAHRDAEQAEGGTE